MMPDLPTTPEIPADVPERGAGEGVSFEPSNAVAEAAAPASGPVAPAPAPPTENPPGPPRPYRRRIGLPIVLFVLTCLSTFYAGATDWRPHERFIESGDAFFQSMLADVPVSVFRPLLHDVTVHWREGLLYMACVLAILFAHEMGHFVMTVIYRVRASLPYFIPLPITPIGTMGAVIGMDGMKANRREIFDIGLAGPLAGLVIAVPIIWFGISQLDLEGAVRRENELSLDLPLAMRLLVDQLHPGEYKPTVGVPIARVNAYFMAGWVGLLVTGLNMLPVSQLDGGHVTYALFGRWAHWLARLFMLAVLIYMGVSAIWYQQVPGWILMAILVLVIGTDHPPTSDDSVKLGWGRTLLGLASLAIPIFCFIPRPLF
jgi:Zn-dependent protease